MTEKLETILAKVRALPACQADVLLEFDAFLANDDKSERWRVNLLKALINFSKPLGPIDFRNVGIKEVQSFLNTKKKGKEIDPDERWRRTYNDYLAWLTTFFRWLYNNDKGIPRKEWQTPQVTIMGADRVVSVRIAVVTSDS